MHTEEGALTNHPFSHTEGRTHSLHFLAKIPGHTHSDSLSHTDWLAHPLAHSPAQNLPLSHNHKSSTLTHRVEATLTVTS